MKRTLMLILSALLALAAGAQSADRVTEVLEADRVTYGQVGYLAATMLELEDEDASDEDALRALGTEGYVEKDADAAAAVTLGDAALLCAKLWNISGGAGSMGSLWYRAFPNRRYALRLLKSNGLVSPAADPQKVLSGRDALNLFTACLERYSTEGAE